MSCHVNPSIVWILVVLSSVVSSQRCPASRWSSTSSHPRSTSSVGCSMPCFSYSTSFSRSSEGSSVDRFRYLRLRLRSFPWWKTESVETFFTELLSGDTEPLWSPGLTTAQPLLSVDQERQELPLVTLHSPALVGPGQEAQTGGGPQRHLDWHHAVAPLQVQGRDQPALQHVHLYVLHLQALAQDAQLCLQVHQRWHPQVQVRSGPLQPLLHCHWQDGPPQAQDRQGDLKPLHQVQWQEELQGHAKEELQQPAHVDAWQQEAPGQGRQPFQLQEGQEAVGLPRHHLHHGCHRDLLPAQVLAGEGGSQQHQVEEAAGPGFSRHRLHLHERQRVLQVLQAAPLLLVVAAGVKAGHQAGQLLQEGLPADVLTRHHEEQRGVPLCYRLQRRHRQGGAGVPDQGQGVLRSGKGLGRQGHRDLQVVEGAELQGHHEQGPRVHAALPAPVPLRQRPLRLRPRGHRRGQRERGGGGQHRVGHGGPHQGGEGGGQGLHHPLQLQVLGGRREEVLQPEQAGLAHLQEEVQRQVPNVPHSKKCLRLWQSQGLQLFICLTRPWSVCRDILCVRTRARQPRQTLTFTPHPTQVRDGLDAGKERPFGSTSSSPCWFLTRTAEDQTRGVWRKVKIPIRVPSGWVWSTKRSSLPRMAGNSGPAFGPRPPRDGTILRQKPIIHI